MKDRILLYQQRPEKSKTPMGQGDIQGLVLQNPFIMAMNGSLAPETAGSGGGRL